MGVPGDPQRGASVEAQRRAPVHVHLHLRPVGSGHRGIGSSHGVAVSLACSKDLGQLGQLSDWQVYA